MLSICSTTAICCNQVTRMGMASTRSICGLVMAHLLGSPTRGRLYHRRPGLPSPAPENPKLRPSLSKGQILLQDTIIDLLNASGLEPERDYFVVNHGLASVLNSTGALF